MNHHESLKWWREYGDYVLMATAYHDQVIVGVEDCTYTDADGNEYLDLNAGTMCAHVGHHHPELISRLREQMEHVIHTGTSFLSPIVFQASKKLAEVSPGRLRKSVFLSTGAEANEYAIRLAKHYTEKSGVLALTKGYSGLSYAMSALTGGGKGVRPRMPETGYILTPDVNEWQKSKWADRSPEDWMLELFEHSLELNRGLLRNVAAIIVEPIPSTGGMITLPEGFMRLLRSLADEIGALLICDEAQTGMGRTGRWWGIEHENVEPDILVAAKGIGGGFPVSAVVTTPKIADKVATRMSHYSSHQSDQLACAAVLAVLEIVQSHDLVSNAAEVGDYLIRRLGELAENHANLVNIRGRGLMVGFDVSAPGPLGRKRPRDTNMDDRRLGAALVEGLHKRGIHIHPLKNQFRVMPPLTIGRPQIDRFITALDDVLGELAAGKLRPHGPRNEQTAAMVRERYSSRLGSVARWAWTHSPRALVEKLGEKLNGQKAVGPQSRGDQA